MKNILILFFLISSLFVYSQNVWFVAPVDSGGNDLADGTIIEPWGTWQTAFNRARPGDTVYFRGGVYKTDNRVFIDPTGEFKGYYNGNSAGVSGVKGALIHYFGYPDDIAAGNWPILSCEGNCSDAGGQVTNINNGIVLQEVQGLHFKDLEVRNVYQCAQQIYGGIQCSGTANLVFENFRLHNIGEVGFNYYGGAQILAVEDGVVETSYLDTYIDTTKWINCDVWDLCDTLSATPGNSADAWHVKTYRGNQITFDGCRAWNYTDDMGDLMPGTGSKYIINNCWAIGSDKYSDIDKTFAGVGGWKCTAPAAPPDSNYHSFTFTNNIAAFGGGFFSNFFAAREGYYQSNNRIHNNTAFKCNPIGFYEYVDTSDHQSPPPTIYRNNLSFASIVRDFGVRYPSFSIEESNNTWDVGVQYGSYYFRTTDTFSVSYDDFYYDIKDSLSLVNLLKAPRGIDGSLPPNPFRLKESSNLIDMGMDIGLPYYGEKPDIGAYEFGTTAVKILRPFDNDTFLTRDIITLEAIVADTIHSINSVKFFIEDKEKKIFIGDGFQKSDSQIWKLNWDCDTITNSTNYIRAIAENSIQKTATSQRVQLNIYKYSVPSPPPLPEKCILYPQVTNGLDFTLRLPEKLPVNSEIHIISSEGRLVAVEKMSKFQQFKSDFNEIHKLKSGMYFLQFVNDSNYQPCNIPLRFLILK